MGKSILKDTKALTSKGFALGLALILVAVCFIGLYGNGQGWWTAPSGGGTSPQGNDWWSGGSGVAPTQAPSGGGGYAAAALRVNVVDALTGAGVTTSTTTISVKGAINGVVSFLDKATNYDTVTDSANPEETNTPWAQGAEVFVQVLCTGNPSSGLDYYDQLYRTVLQPGAPVYRVTMANLVETNNGGQYTYSFNAAGAEQVGSVAYTSVSNTPYWYLGNLGMYPRLAAAGTDITLSYQGATLSTVTDGTSWDDTVAEINANATLASHTSARISLQMVGGNANLGWGKSQLIVSANTGQLKEYKPCIIMSTGMLGIGVSELQSEGWVSINAPNLYAEKAFYKVVTQSDSKLSGTMWPSSGQTAEWTMTMPVVTTGATASTEYLFKFWIVDMVNTDNLVIGSDTTTMPTAYGALSYGIGQRTGNTAFTISSGLGATNQLEVYLTTAS